MQIAGILAISILTGVTPFGVSQAFAYPAPHQPMSQLPELGGSDLTEHIAEKTCGSGGELEAATQLLVAKARGLSPDKKAMAVDRARTAAEQITRNMENKVFLVLESVCQWNKIGPALGIEKKFEYQRTGGSIWSDTACEPKPLYDRTGVQGGAANYLSPITNIRAKYKDFQRASDCLALLDKSFDLNLPKPKKGRLAISEVPDGLLISAPEYPRLRTTCDANFNFVRVTTAMACLMRGQQTLVKEQSKISMIVQDPTGDDPKFRTTLDARPAKGVDNISEVFKSAFPFGGK